MFALRHSPVTSTTLQFQHPEMRDAWTRMRVVTRIPLVPLGHVQKVERGEKRRDGVMSPSWRTRSPEEHEKGGMDNDSQ